jgi:uncharacterized protein with HEPN domain
MPRNVQPAIHDILETITRVQEKTAGKTLGDLQADWEPRFIVERAIEIISEASRRLPNEIKATRPEIPWRSVAGIGNVLRHEYHTISDKVIWDVVHGDLPALKTAVEAMAAEIQGK